MSRAILVFIGITYTLSIAIGLIVWLTGGHASPFAFFEEVGWRGWLLESAATRGVSWDMGHARHHELFGRWTTVAMMLAVMIALASGRAALVAQAQEYVVTIAGSKEYHRPDCPLVQKNAASAVMLRSQAEGKGLKSHKDCDPANAPAGGQAVAKPEFVYTQPNDNKYHRADCKLLGKEARRVPLDKATVRGRWPCTTCRPPILGSPKPAR